MGLFITFEGGEGSGKSTQAKALKRRLEKAGYPAILTHEPGGTRFGQRASRWLKWEKDMKLSAVSELLLFSASRAQLVGQIIRPMLEKAIVICDRFTDSTLAYQSYGRGIDEDTVRKLNNLATGGLVPDLTVLLDIPVAEGMARAAHRKPDRFEQEALDFHQRVRDSYLEMAAAEPGRWLVLDARMDRRELAGAIGERVSRLLEKKESAARRKANR